MTKTVTKRVLGALGIAVVAVGSYAVGVAQGKRPVNLSVGEMRWEPFATGSPLQIVRLWGDRTKGEYGMLLKLPAGTNSGMHAHSGDYHALTVQGTWVHTNEGDNTTKDLPPGSYVMQPGKQFHNDVCKGTGDCILFVHQHAKGDFIPPKAPAKK
jgi:hypothetical protein